MSPSPAPSRLGPAPPRLVVVLGGFASLAFITGIVLAILDPAEVGIKSHQADSFSRSAIGHRGLVRWLRALDVPVVVSQSSTADKATFGTLLAILEPPTDDPERLRRLIADAGSQVVLIALPKWEGEIHETEDGFVGVVRPVDDADRDAVLDALLLDATSGPAPSGRWAWFDDPPPVEPQLTRPMGMRGAVLPMLTRDDTIVIGEQALYGKRLIVVADPDLLANAGLVANAPLLMTVLSELIPPGGAVIVDETLHGHQSAASLLRQLFEFPLAAVSIQVLLMLLLAIGAGLRRFGAPVPAGAGLSRGRRVLLENTAALSHFAGHDDDALRRYWRLTSRAVQRALHAPSELTGADAMAWLARVGRARGVEGDPAELSAASNVAPREQRLTVARQIDAWRRSMIERRRAPQQTPPTQENR